MCIIEKTSMECVHACSKYNYHTFDKANNKSVDHVQTDLYLYCSQTTKYVSP